MAEESVGKVSLDLELKSDLQGQIQGLSGKISSLFKKPLAGLSKSTTSQMNKATDTVKKSVSGIGNPVKKQMQAVVQSVQSGMKKAMDFSKLSKGFKTSGDDKLNLQYQKQLEALKKQEILVSEIQQKLDRAMQGTAKPTALKGLEAEFKKVQAEIKKTESVMAETEQRMEMAKFSAQLDKGAHGKVSSGTASEISRLEAELDRLGTVLADSDAKAANLQAKISQMQMNPAASSGADILRQKLSLATDKMNRLGAESQATKAKMDGVNSSGSIFDRLREKLAGLGSGLKKAGGFIGGFIKKLAHMRSQSKKTQSSIGGLGKGFMRLGTMLKSMILYRGFAILMNGAKEGFQNLAQYSDSTNQSLSMLMSALTQLKNSCWKFLDTQETIKQLYFGGAA